MVTERDTIYCKSEIYSPVEQKKKLYSVGWNKMSKSDQWDRKTNFVQKALFTKKSRRE